MKKGILTKPKHEPDTTKFKLVVWYDKKPNGEFYTQFEKASNKNRKYHDSIDFILTTKGNVTRHDEALNKLLHHLEKYKDNISTAMLMMNDQANDKQYCIGKFSKDETKNKFVQPLFKHYANTGHVFAFDLLAPALSEYKLKRHKTL